MDLQNLFDEIEETIIDLLARIDEGDKKALEELKKVKIYFEDITEILSTMDEDETIETVKRKFDTLSKKFDKFLIDIVRVVG